MKDGLNSIEGMHFMCARSKSNDEIIIFNIFMNYLD